MHQVLVFSAALTVGALACTIDTTPGSDRGGPYAAQDAGWYGDVDGSTPTTSDAGLWPADDAGSRPPYVDAGPWWGEDAGYVPVDGGVRPGDDAGSWPGDDAGSWPGDDAGMEPPRDGGVTGECASITHEAVCVVTPECEAVYTGVNCVCYSDGTCRCEAWIFSECE